MHLLWAALLALPAASLAQTFQNLSQSSGTIYRLLSTNLAWGDYDNDGLADLYVTSWGTAFSSPVNALYRNQGDGTFADRAAASGVDVRRNSTAAAWADYDNDGDLDLYVADFFDQDLLFQNQGDGTFAEVGRSRRLVNLVRQGSVMSVAWGDYNNDGHLDFYLGKYYHDNELYHNNGDGTFAPVTDLGLNDKRDTQTALWADYDNDGDLDLYTINREQENGLFRNDLNTLGTFSSIACALTVDNTEIGQSGAWADYDNDGDLDLYLASVGANALYRNDGGEAFADVAQEAGVRVDNSGWLSTMAAWADYEGDGDLDLYVTTGGDRQPQRNLLYASNGDGTFRNATAEAGLPTGVSYHMAAAWGDLDANGAPDLYVTDGVGQGNQLFQNNAPGSLFLRLRLQGRGGQQGGSNRDAIGARVRLLDSAGELVAYRQVLAGGAQLSFGVEQGQTYSVEVLFPGAAAPTVERGLSGGDLVIVQEP